MKRLASSDSLGALMSICPNSTDGLNPDCNPIYTREFQTMLDGLDEEGCVEESGHVSEKKRRLSVDQVKALEKNFEVENKLEPERKVKLAQELGLQPRQVAVWFQNRRARYKTKQLERDYGILKASYDNLKQNYDTLQRDKETLLKEIREMKSKQSGDGKTESKVFVKQEAMVSDTDTEEKSKAETPVNSLAKCDEAAATELDFHNFIGNHTTASMETGSVFLDFKDGSSDSTDSSAILNEENNSPIQFLEIQNASTTSMNCSFQISDSKPSAASIILGDDAHKNYQPQFVKIEEHNFLGEESCSTLFSDDQAPTLHWCCSDQWN